MAAAEQKKSYQVIKQFEGLDTKANRTAIKDTEFSWLENAMPIGYSNLKIVPNYTSLGVTFSQTVLNLFSTNVGLNDYLIAFESDGSCEYVNLETNIKGTLAAAGTFTATGQMNISQWKNQYLLIIDPVKGYFTWDGTNLLPIGSVGLIGIVNGGSNYTTAPVVTISAPSTPNGVQATAVASITAGTGSVDAINITNIGDHYTSVPVVTIGAPNLSTGAQANAAATIQSGNVVAISITNGGAGYTSPPSVTITGGGGANAAATSQISTGSVNAIFLTNAGSGYTSPPTVTLTGGGGSGASALAELVTFATGTVQVAVINGGSGYTNSANITLTITGGGGANAAGVPIIGGGQVTEVIMTNAGNGYTNSANISVTISGGGGNGASANAVINTNPNSGIQSFSGRVWISNGRTVTYSAAGSPTDFTSVSAGTIVLTDETLHGNITQLLSANNFLYIFGDDSINVFSDVRVTSTGATIFTNTNISASVGSKRPYAIFPYFRSVLFLNDYGVYALVGSTTSKISDALDGVFPYIDFTKPIYAGQVLLNNILCAAFNFYYTGPGGGNLGGRYVQAVFFDKKWFITNQGQSNSFISSAPIAGKINLFGSDGTSCNQLYADSTVAIPSYIQTALMPMGDPIRTKQALKFGIEATNNAGNILNVTVDSETALSPTYSLSNQINWVNVANTIIPWLNNSNVIIPWTAGASYYLYKSDAQQWGKYLGLTLTTTANDMTINTFEFEHELRVRF